MKERKEKQADASGYDLYLVRGCDALPALDDLKEQVPAVTYPVFQQWIVTMQAADPGFLQLELAKTVAETLLQRLQARGASGIVVQAAYRQPKISRAEAQVLAECEIESLRKQYYPTYLFGPVVLYAEQPCSWTYASASKQLIEEGYIPGALFADVDKLDGHIWTPEEVAEG